MNLRSMQRIASRLAAAAIYAITLLPLAGVRGEGQAFAPKSLQGSLIPIDRWPAFVITSRSPDDLNESMRCATRANSWDQAFWILNFAWDQPESAMRLAAAKFLKNDFMKSRSAILGEEYRDSPRVMLIDSRGIVLWRSLSYPTEREWEEAHSIWAGDSEH